MTQEVLKLALEHGSFPQGSGVIHALKEAIKELESQEPVGEVDAIGLNDTDFHVSFKRPMPFGTKLYTHPPQRTWVDLTQQELDELDEESPSLHDFVQNLMFKLKEKNT